MLDAQAELFADNWMIRLFSKVLYGGVGVVPDKNAAAVQWAEGGQVGQVCDIVK